MIATSKCNLLRRSGRNVYGQASYAPAVEIDCAIVKLTRDGERTSRRADASATIGAAREEVSAGRILVLPHESVAIGDVIEVASMKVEVAAVHPMHDACGYLDHWQLELRSWQAQD